MIHYNHALEKVVAICLNNLRLYTLCVIVDATHECREEYESKKSVLIPTIATNLKIRKVDYTDHY